MLAAMLLLIVLVIVLVVVFDRSDASGRAQPRPGMTYVTSTRRPVRFLCRDLPDKQEAADHLADLTAHLQHFVHRLHRAYPTDERVDRLYRRYNPDAVSEQEAQSNMTSYSYNKGEYMVFCIRSRDGKNTLASMNTMTFVGLHELSHVMTVSKGHDETFWENFRFLLAHAIKWKYYVAVDYMSKPKPYCGTHITDTPLRPNDSHKYITYDEAIDQGDIKQGVYFDVGMDTAAHVKKLVKDAPAMDVAADPTED